MTKISSLIGRRVWDSRGVPTLEAEITLENGKRGRAIAPSGASRGTREALELRDGGKKLGGKDVQSALTHLNGPLADALQGMSVHDQAELDHALITLDPSPLKETMGGNAIIAASLAALQAAAADQGCRSGSILQCIIRKRRLCHCLKFKFLGAGLMPGDVLIFKTS